MRSEKQLRRITRLAIGRRDGVILDWVSYVLLGITKVTWGKDEEQ